jgi:hypothetical protein
MEIKDKGETQLIRGGGTDTVQLWWGIVVERKKGGGNLHPQCVHLSNTFQTPMTQLIKHIPLSQ